jgi:hypothetical protein
MARNLLLFLALATTALAGQQLVASSLGHEPGGLSYTLGSIGYSLVVSGVVALVFLVPGLLFLAAAEEEARLSPVLMYVVAAVVSTLAFAPFVFNTYGDLDVIPLAVGALAYAALIRRPARRLTQTAA